MMGRLVSTYPNWACQVAMKQGDIHPETRQRFRDIVVQTRRPDALNGRPTLADNTDPAAIQRR